MARWGALCSGCWHSEVRRCVFVIAVQFTCRTSAWFIAKGSTASREAREGSENGSAKKNHQKKRSNSLLGVNVSGLDIIHIHHRLGPGRGVLGCVIDRCPLDLAVGTVDIDTLVQMHIFDGTKVNSPLDIDVGWTAMCSLDLDARTCARTHTCTTAACRTSCTPTADSSEASHAHRSSDTLLCAGVCVYVCVCARALMCVCVCLRASACVCVCARVRARMHASSQARGFLLVQLGEWVCACICTVDNRGLDPQIECDHRLFKCTCAQSPAQIFHGSMHTRAPTEIKRPARPMH